MLEDEPDPIAVVISGGVTRGAYQGGQTWMITEALKRAKKAERVEEVAFTDSSAGSINALLAATALIQEPIAEAPVPEESLFFEAWVPMGLTNDERSVDYHPPSYPGEDTEAVAGLRLTADDGVISHHAFALVLDALDETWQPEEHAGVFDEVLVGLTAARLEAESDKTGMIREVNEAFAFLLERDEEEARVMDLECPGDDPEECDAEDLVLQWRRDSVPYRAMSTFVKPSSGIPIAFPLWSLDCDEYERLSLWPRQCHSGEGRDPILLMDGGTFDGNPMEVARRLVTRPGTDPDPFFIFLDPDLEFNPEKDPLPAESSSAERVEALLSGFVTTARMQNLTDFRRDQREAFEDTLFIQTRTVPIAAYMGNFYGIFDRSFRVWDFYAGVWDTTTQLGLRKANVGLIVEPNSKPYLAVAQVLEAAGAVRQQWRDKDADCQAIRLRLAEETDLSGRWVPHPRDLPGGGPNHWGGLALDAGVGYAWNLRDAAISPTALFGFGLSGAVLAGDAPEDFADHPTPELVFEIGVRRQPSGLQLR